MTIYKTNDVKALEVIVNLCKGMDYKVTAKMHRGIPSYKLVVNY